MIFFFLQCDLEAEEEPADLSARVVFKAPNKNKRPPSSSSSKSEHKSKKLKNKATLLSFDDDEEDDVNDN